jgi:hypothetical protein
MGDNDLRTHAVHGAQRVQENTQTLINLHKNTPHGLLLFGCLPSPATFPQTTPLANYLDDLVEKEVIKLTCSDPSAYGNIGFVHTSVLFCNQENSHQLFEKDGIHLNEMGAQFLAHHILSYTSKLAKLMRL